MSAGRNYNIITKYVRPTPAAGSAVSVGSSVATGKTRYVTFIHVSRVQGATGLGVKLYFASTAASGATLTLASASASAKMKLFIGSASCDGNLSVPDKINTEHPLFSIAAGKFLSVRQGSTAALGRSSAAVMIQYYDQ